MLAPWLARQTFHNMSTRRCTWSPYSWHMASSLNLRPISLPRLSQPSIDFQLEPSQPGYLGLTSSCSDCHVITPVASFESATQASTLLAIALRTLGFTFLYPTW